jgi:hypothetical protein
MCPSPFENGFRMFADQKRTHTFENGLAVFKWRCSHIMKHLDYTDQNCGQQTKRHMRLFELRLTHVVVVIQVQSALLTYLLLRNITKTEFHFVRLLRHTHMCLR